MTKIIERTFDLETGKTVDAERNMTSEEIAQVEAAQVKAAQLQAQAEARATQKAALLNRLGITEDEAKLLLA